MLFERLFLMRPALEQYGEEHSRKPNDVQFAIRQSYKELMKQYLMYISFERTFVENKTLIAEKPYLASDAWKDHKRDWYGEVSDHVVDYSFIPLIGRHMRYAPFYLASYIQGILLSEILFQRIERAYLRSDFQNWLPKFFHRMFVVPGPFFCDEYVGQQLGIDIKEEYRMILKGMLT